MLKLAAGRYTTRSAAETAVVVLKPRLLLLLQCCCCNCCRRAADAVAPFAPTADGMQLPPLLLLLLPRGDDWWNTAKVEPYYLDCSNLWPPSKSLFCWKLYLKIQSYSGYYCNIHNAINAFQSRHLASKSKKVNPSDSAIYIYLLIYLWIEVLWFIYLVHWTLACNKCVYYYY